MHASRRLFCLVLAVFSIFTPVWAQAGMSSTNYQVPWDEWGSAGNEAGLSASYQIDDTLGGLGVGRNAGAVYAALAGYRLSDTRAISFSVAMAPVSGAAATYTGLDSVTKTITLTSSAAVSSFSVGDDIAVIENPGLSQLTAVGRIVSIGASSITVDRFEGQVGLMSASPSSGQIVLLSGGNISFGEVSVASGAVATGMVAVQVPTTSGYTLYAQSTGGLASSGHSITGVADGSVTAGSEEFGIRTLGTKSSITEDTALTTTPLSIQSSLSASNQDQDRSALLYKVALSSSTPAGAYGQSIFFTLTANY